MNRLICVAVFTLAASAAMAQNVKVAHVADQNVLQTQNGASLYVYDGDEVDRSGRGRSSCNKQCAQEWPPFLAKAGAKPKAPWSLITRQDGSKQWAYKDRPLYTFNKPSTPGAAAGNGSNGNKWHLAMP